MLVVRLQHLAVRCASICGFEEVNHIPHFQDEKKGGRRYRRAFICPISIVGERGPSNVSHQRHPSVGRKRGARLNGAGPRSHQQCRAKGRGEGEGERRWEELSFLLLHIQKLRRVIVLPVKVGRNSGVLEVLEVLEVRGFKGKGIK